jgi:regulator of protease activity HflC (stomatin/prohibitin superfamily)
VEPFFFLVFLVFGGSVLTGSVKIINQGNEALVETLGKYNGKKTGTWAEFRHPFPRPGCLPANHPRKSLRHSPTTVHHPRQCVNHR